MTITSILLGNKAVKQPEWTLVHYGDFKYAVSQEVGRTLTRLRSLFLPSELGFKEVDCGWKTGYCRRKGINGVPQLVLQRKHQSIRLVALETPEHLEKSILNVTGCTRLEEFTRFREYNPKEVIMDAWLGKCVGLSVGTGSTEMEVYQAFDNYAGNERISAFRLDELRQSSKDWSRGLHLYQGKHKRFLNITLMTKDQIVSEIEKECFDAKPAEIRELVLDDSSLMNFGLSLENKAERVWNTIQDSLEKMIREDKEGRHMHLRSRLRIIHYLQDGGSIANLLVEPIDVQQKPYNPTEKLTDRAPEPAKTDSN